MRPQPQEADIFSSFRLDGRVAFVSGAAGHLGRPMTEALAAAGAHVILNGRRQNTLEDFAEDLRSRGRSASIACFDVTDAAAVREHAAQIDKEHGRLDVLVNNAGGGRPGTMESATAEDFEQAYKLNVTAAFGLLQAAIPLLREAANRTKGSASVINISSMYGNVSPDPSIYGGSGANSPPYYAAAKGGLLQLTRYSACHLAPYRIRVNCISPGPFPAAQYLERDPAFHEKLNSKNPMHRTGDPVELQGPLLFLASEASSYVTGINLPVDGGWTAW